MSLNQPLRVGRKLVSRMQAIAFPAAILIVAWSAANLYAGQTVWNFDGGLTPTSGSGAITYRGDTGSLVQFGTARGFGLPDLPGGDSGVMFIPATTAAQGVYLDHASPPNGVYVDNGWVSNYTLVFDLLWPATSSGQWRSFLNTNLENANDGDFFADPADAIGISGNYRGRLRSNTWHRVALVVGAADGEGQLQRYIDGEFVGGQGTTGSAISSRWALFAQPGPDLILFGDNNGETQPVYLSSLMFIDGRMTQAEVAALGGPRAEGVAAPGTPWIQPQGAWRRVEAIAHRGDSAHAPENTIVALQQAFALGAQTCEIDLRLSADGVAVLMHDADLFRTTNATGPVAGRTAASLRTLDAGEWFDPRFDGEPVPTLAEALIATRGRGRLYLDVKVNGMGPAIRQALLEAGMTPADIWIWAYDDVLRAEFVAAMPAAQVVIGWFPPTVDDAAFATLRAQGVVGFDFNMNQMRAAPAGFVEAARRNGFFISVYTILDPLTMREAIDLGVDMMETDFPATLLRAIAPLGDMNCDARVNFDDLDGFVSALIDPRSYQQLYPACGWRHGDITGDRAVNFDDIEGFVGCLVRGACEAE